MKLKVLRWPGFADKNGKLHGPGEVIEVSDKDGAYLLQMNPHLFEAVVETKEKT